MKILVACEESQAVTKELRRLDQSGGHPEWHIRQDVLPLLNGDCTFSTADGQAHAVAGKWDMIIAFPPCTHLAVSGAAHFAKKRADGRQQQGIDFFMRMASADCPRIAIENPIGIMSTQWRKPDQIIQPWQFASTEAEKTEKSTCLWLKGLAPLQTAIKEKPDLAYFEWTTREGKTKRQTLWYYNTRCLPHSERARAASKTFLGIARAMAEQWAGPALKEVEDDWML